ncbi:MAG: radical SAM protein [Pseudomonadota bacterium]
MSRSPLLRRLLYPAYKSLETSVHPLRYLFVEITQRCNLACRHCGSDCTRDSRLDELSADEWLRFLDALPARIDRRQLALVVTGGEPFCAPHLDAILDGLQRNQLQWGMVTNGYALTDRNLHKALAHGLMSMTVSLDGLRDRHDWLRGVDGSFERAVDGIRRVVTAGLPFFDVVTCVHPGNLEQLPALRELLRELGVRAWRLFCIFPKGRAAQDRQLLLDDAGQRQLFEWIAEQRAQLDDRELCVQFSCEGFLPRHIDRAVRREPYFCRAGISIASVLADGSISGCPNIDRSLVQGNIRCDDFFEVWDKRFAPFRDRAWMQQGQCDGCAEFSGCQGNSLHLYDAEARDTARCFVKSLTST